MAVETRTQCRLIEKKGLTTLLILGYNLLFQLFFLFYCKEKSYLKDQQLLEQMRYSQGVLMTALISTDIGDPATKICGSQCSYFITKQLINNTDVILIRGGSVASTNAVRRRIELVR